MRILLILFVVLALLGTPAPVKADIAPPAMPPGSNPQPGSENTQVRMLAETVSMDILAEAPKGSLGMARVTATFYMHNLGDKEEQMAVRFPVGVSSDPRTNNPRITDMAVKVNGAAAAIRSITGEDPYYGGGSVPWIEFDAVFPAGKDVTILVSYTLEAGGESPYALFSYIFSTGAGWNGTIGSATLFVRFPYEVSELNVLPSIRADEPNLVADHKISASELKWTWTDFEPDYGSNFEISVVVPSLWQNALDLEKKLKTKAWDGELWGMLGKTYKSFTFDSRGKGFRGGFNYTGDAGTRELFHSSVVAYENAIRLKALDAQWHAGFADLLISYAYFAAYEGVDTGDQMWRGLMEMNTALRLSPTDAKVREIADQLLWIAGDGMVKVGDDYEFPWLTATPVPTATFIGMDIGTTTPEAPAITPDEATKPALATAAETEASTEAATKATPESGEKPIPLCGSALLPLIIATWVLITRKV